MQRIGWRVEGERELVWGKVAVRRPSGRLHMRARIEGRV